MDIHVIAGPRNLLGIILIISSVWFQPEASFAVVRPLVSLWRRLKLFKASLAAKFRSSRSERFWEIDMTKFEP